MACLPPAHSGRALAALCLLGLLGGCATSECQGPDCTSSDTINREGDPITANKVDAQNPDAESVQSITLDGNSLSFAVISNGCTTATDFHVDHEFIDGTCTATLVRDNPDLCRRAPFVAELAMTWQAPENCRPEAVAFTNPVIDLAEKLDSLRSRRAPRNN